MWSSRAPSETPDARRVAALVGAVTGRWPHPGSEGDSPASGHLAFVQEFLPGVEDAWRVALRAAQAGADFAGPARALGEATAEVHATLAEALGTQPTTREQAAAIVAEMRAGSTPPWSRRPTSRRSGTVRDGASARRATPTGPLSSGSTATTTWVRCSTPPSGGGCSSTSRANRCARCRRGRCPTSGSATSPDMLRSFDYVGGTCEQLHGTSARDWVTSAQQVLPRRVCRPSRQRPPRARRPPRRLRAGQGDVRGLLRGAQPPGVGHHPARRRPATHGPLQPRNPTQDPTTMQGDPS